MDERSTKTDHRLYFQKHPLKTAVFNEEKHQKTRKNYQTSQAFGNTVTTFSRDRHISGIFASRQL